MKLLPNNTPTYASSIMLDFPVSLDFFLTDLEFEQPQPTGQWRWRSPNEKTKRTLIPGSELQYNALSLYLWITLPSNDKLNIFGTLHLTLKN